MSSRPFVAPGGVAVVRRAAPSATADPILPRPRLAELTEALNLADGLARSPASIASFLEAAGAAALELAGKILVRRS
jgi:hypothetical protein